MYPANKQAVIQGHVPRCLNRVCSGLLFCVWGLFLIIFGTWKFSSQVANHLPMSQLFHNLADTRALGSKWKVWMCFCALNFFWKLIKGSQRVSINKLISSRDSMKCACQKPLRSLKKCSQQVCGSLIVHGMLQAHWCWWRVVLLLKNLPKWIKCLLGEKKDDQLDNVPCSCFGWTSCDTGKSSHAHSPCKCN